jgi:hypothetical protein
MTSPLRRALLVMFAMGAVSSAQAQLAQQFKVVNVAAEVPARSLTLTASSAVFPTCGDCATKSFPTTAATRYYLKRTVVTVDQLRAALAGRPDLIVTVKYSAKSSELISVSAELDPPR